MILSNKRFGEKPVQPWLRHLAAGSTPRCHLFTSNVCGNFSCPRALGRMKRVSCGDQGNDCLSREESAVIDPTYNAVKDNAFFRPVPQTSLDSCETARRRSSPMTLAALRSSSPLLRWAFITIEDVGVHHHHHAIGYCA